jgi:nicotinamidase-related amidase
MNTEALMVIDAQVNMFDPAHAVHDATAVLGRLQALVAGARAAGRPVVFVRNCGNIGDPDVPGTPGWQLQPSLEPAPGEPVFDKTTCDTFASTALHAELAARGVTAVVIAGMQSDWCIRETTLGALQCGLSVTLVSDGHSTYDGRTRSAEAIVDSVNVELSDRVSLVRAADVSWG